MAYTYHAMLSMRSLTQRPQALCVISLCYDGCPRYFIFDRIILNVTSTRLQIQLGVNMPARAEHIPAEDKTQLFHEVYDVVLYLGIIDILQEYNMTKKIEHAYKSLQFDSLSISVVDPEFYSQRFLRFIQTVFPENT